MSNDLPVRFIVNSVNRASIATDPSMACIWRIQGQEALPIQPCNLTRDSEAWQWGMEHRKLQGSMRIDPRQARTSPRKFTRLAQERRSAAAL